MLFMVIENFKGGSPKSVRERFTRHGRLLPDGVVYHMSWVDATGARCFQIMEASDAEILNVWARSWEDLIEFEIVPVVTASEFWAKDLRE